MSTGNGRGGFAAPETPEEEVRDELDVYNRVTKPAAKSPEFEGVNYGLGYYADDAELYRQVQSFRDGKYGRAAFKRAIRLRAEREAKAGYLREQHRLKDPTKDFEDWVETNEDRWEDADEAEKRDAIREHAGIEPTWTPPQWSMAEMRLETSRGRDARLLDNVFGRVVEKIAKGGEAAREALKDLTGTKR